MFLRVRKNEVEECFSYYSIPVCLEQVVSYVRLQCDSLIRLSFQYLYQLIIRILFFAHK